MALVTVNPAFVVAAEGGNPGTSVDFGIVRRLYGHDGRALDDGRTADVARINGSAAYTCSRFVSVVQALLIDDLRKLSIGEGNVDGPDDVYSVDYMVGVVDSEGNISHFVTVEVTDPESWQEFRQDIELNVQYELQRGAVHGNDTQGLTRLYEVYFAPPSIPVSELKVAR